MAKDRTKKTPFVNDVEATNETLTSRAGINLFVRYLRESHFIQLFDRFFSLIRKNKKGLSITDLFIQILCWLFDGTCRHLTYFDTLAKDSGYAAAIEMESNKMASSHAVKRFFQAIPIRMSSLFRLILQRLFIWRLTLEKPSLIILNLDVMIMDNDDAQKREFVEPTYKRKRGFAPLQMTWGPFIIDAIFRSGSKHSNYGDDTNKMIRRAVTKIRDKYREDVPIIVRMDSGYFDQKLFKEMEALGVGYIVGGRFCTEIKDLIASIPTENFERHYGKTDEDIWEFTEFGNCRKAWKTFRRTIFWRPFLEEKRFLLPGSRPGTLVYTNLGMGQPIDEQLERSGHGHLVRTEEVVKSYHQRGADELVHRSLKDFGFEELPFKKFAANSALYYMMLLGFFLFESFKRDVSDPVIPVSATPTTLRRKLLDIAGKIVKSGRKIKLKVPAAVMAALNFKELWERSGKGPRLSWT